MRLLCMSFDGDYQLERPEFESEESVWEYSNDIGSKWYFYPFHFVVTNSGKTIKASGRFLEFLNGRRVTSVQKWFSTISTKEEAQNLNVDEYVELLQQYYYGW